MLVNFKAEPREKESWVAAAKQRGMTLSEFLRFAANLQANPMNVNETVGPATLVGEPVVVKTTSEAVRKQRTKTCEHGTPPEMFCKRCSA